jgi:hypothetical protein
MPFALRIFDDVAEREVIGLTFLRLLVDRVDTLMVQEARHPVADLITLIPLLPQLVRSEGRVRVRSVALPRTSRV